MQQGVRLDGRSVNSNKEDLEEVACYRYLGVNVTVDGTIGAEVKHRVEARAKVLGTLWSMSEVSVNKGKNEYV